MKHTQDCTDLDQELRAGAALAEEGGLLQHLHLRASGSTRTSASMSASMSTSMSTRMSTSMSTRMAWASAAPAPAGASVSISISMSTRMSTTVTRSKSVMAEDPLRHRRVSKYTFKCKCARKYK